MIVAGKLYNVGTIADVLARALGCGRQWVDTLNDFRQGRSPGVMGLVLLPFKRTGGTLSTAGRPLYRQEDVRSFIVAVRGACGTDRPLHTGAVLYEYDDTPGLP